MQKNLIYSVYWSIVVILLAGCSAETLESADANIGNDYFPLNVGSYRIYDVKSIEYIYSGDNDTSLYYLKEVVADTFTNLEGNEAFRIERLVSESIDGEWEIDSVWTATNDLSQAIVFENNLPYIKLVFPVEEDKEWDGNSMSALEEDLYVMQDVNRSYTVSDTLTFDQTVTVVQEEENDNLIYSENRSEVYAKDVGLIYKEHILLNYCSETDCIGQYIIETGTDYRMELVAYGKE